MLPTLTLADLTQRCNAAPDNVHSAAARLILSRMAKEPEMAVFDGESRADWLSRASRLIAQAYQPESGAPQKETPERPGCACGAPPSACSWQGDTRREWACEACNTEAPRAPTRADRIETAARGLVASMADVIEHQRQGNASALYTSITDVLVRHGTLTALLDTKEA